MANSKSFSLGRAPLTQHNLAHVPLPAAGFRQYIRDTKYKTESETFGWSFVLEMGATDQAKALSNSSVKDATHWMAVPQAYWRAPRGPGSGIKVRETAL